MIEFSKIERRNPIDNSTAWYPRIELGTAANSNDVIAGIVEKCTLTKADVKACLVALEEVIIEQLKNGNAVRFGDLGSFRPTLKTRKWSESKKAYINGGQPVPTTTYNADGSVKQKGVTADNIAGINVDFSKSAGIKKKLVRSSLAFKMVAGEHKLPEQE